ncbi:hypothetical protein [Ensifer soli]|uniref:hypothetical protein n=1 Tax=Ciceribacter sp. sgz301302 TaxID=3342379 RepID=UPI0035B7B1CC
MRAGKPDCRRRSGETKEACGADGGAALDRAFRVQQYPSAETLLRVLLARYMALKDVFKIRSDGQENSGKDVS